MKKKAVKGKGKEKKPVYIDKVTIGSTTYKPKRRIAKASSLQKTLKGVSWDDLEEVKEKEPAKDSPKLPNTNKIRCTIRPDVAEKLYNLSKSAHAANTALGDLTRELQDRILLESNCDDEPTDETRELHKKVASVWLGVIGIDRDIVGLMLDLSSVLADKTKREKAEKVKYFDKHFGGTATSIKRGSVATDEKGARNP